MTQSVLVSGIERPAAVDVDDKRRKSGRIGNRACRQGGVMRGSMTRGCAMGVMSGTRMMGSARIARVVGLMRRVRGLPVPRIMMRLRLRAGQAKGRSRDQGRGRYASKPAHSRATDTQRHETPHGLHATMRPRRRSQLRYAHSRQRYAAAVTQGLTGFRRGADIFSKPLKSLSAGEDGSRVG